MYAATTDESTVETTGSKETISLVDDESTSSYKKDDSDKLNQGKDKQYQIINVPNEDQSESQVEESQADINSNQQDDSNKIIDVPLVYEDDKGNSYYVDNVTAQEDNDDGKVVGLVAGGVTGAAVGTVTGGTAGAVAGAIVGAIPGAVVGTGIGATSGLVSGELVDENNSSETVIHNSGDLASTPELYLD